MLIIAHSKLDKILVNLNYEKYICGPKMGYVMCLKHQVHVHDSYR